MSKSRMFFAVPIAIGVTVGMFLMLSSVLEPRPHKEPRQRFVIDGKPIPPKYANKSEPVIIVPYEGKPYSQIEPFSRYPIHEPDSNYQCNNPHVSPLSENKKCTSSSYPNEIVQLKSIVPDRCLHKASARAQVIIRYDINTNGCIYNIAILKSENRCLSSDAARTVRQLQPNPPCNHQKNNLAVIIFKK